MVFVYRKNKIKKVLIIKRNFPHAKKHKKQKHEIELSKFFSLMFDINVDKENLDKVTFPTFEEALGILDLAEMRNESFKDFPNINFNSDSGQIKFLRLYLVFLMTDIINSSLEKGKGIHAELINNLKRYKRIDDTVFVTTNYDILCDNALLNLYPKRKVDYGTDFVNYIDGSFERPDVTSIKFIKFIIIYIKS